MRNRYVEPEDFIFGIKTRFHSSGLDGFGRLTGDFTKANDVTHFDAKFMSEGE